MDDGEADPRGALVRPYAVTGGRTRPSADIALEALLESTVAGRESAPVLSPHRRSIVSLCDGRPQSLAEIAALLRQPVGVARVLVADMAADGLLTLSDPTLLDDGTVGTHVLERVLGGLRRL